MQIDREVLREVEAAMSELQRDMLERAQHKMDVIHGEEYRVVNAGNSAWTGFCTALVRLRKAMEARTVAGLTEAEMREQGKKCGCKGTDEYCPCQNVPFRSTLDARKIAGA